MNEGNKNAEVWSEEMANEIFEQVLELSFEDKYDFIGEVCRDLRISRHQLRHLVTRFPYLSFCYEQIKNNLEANCYTNAKKGKIKEATAIINLKANHKWKDRVDSTTDDKPIQHTVINLGSGKKPE